MTPRDAHSQRLNDVERSNLVAYLDGELAEDEAARLGAKITLSVSARREVDVLEKTWELLDFLPKPRAPEQFTARTLGQASLLDARGDRLASAAVRVGRVAGLVATCLAATAATTAVGYAAARWGWPDRTARLARELPLAEHLDEYRDLKSFEFLQLLEKSEFGQDSF